MENDIWNEISSFLNQLRCENINRESYIYFQELANIQLKKKMEKEKYMIGQELIEIFEKVLKTENISVARKTRCDLSMTEIHTVAAIGKNTLYRMSDIAGILHITVGTLTVMVNNLVKKGYVERYKSEQDRRVVKIGLTRKGRIIYDAHAAFHEDLVNALLKGIESKEEQQTVRCALSNLWDFIDKQNN